MPCGAGATVTEPAREGVLEVVPPVEDHHRGAGDRLPQRGVQMPGGELGAAQGR